MIPGLSFCHRCLAVAVSLGILSMLQSTHTKFFSFSKFWLKISILGNFLKKKFQTKLDLLTVCLFSVFLFSTLLTLVAFFFMRSVTHLT